MKWKRLIYYLGINILVSACTVLVVLQLWQHYQSRQPAFPPAAISPMSEAAPLYTVTPWVELSPVPAAVVTVTVPVVVTPSPQPPRGAITYTVQSGDTLGAIAVRFDVSVEALMGANDLVNPDVVAEGQVLVIPPAEGLLPTETATPLPATPTPTTTPTPAVSATPAGPTPIPQISIVAVIGAGDLNTEHVQIRLSGGGELSLKGWLLKDEDGHVYSFPDLTLFANGAIAVYTKAGTTTVNFLYWGLDQAIWRSGETATLVDGEGTVQAVFVIP